MTTKRHKITPAGEVGANGGGGPTCLTRPLWRE